jgi:hypothetical protein
MRLLRSGWEQQPSREPRRSSEIALFRNPVTHWPLQVAPFLYFLWRVRA